MNLSKWAFIALLLTGKFVWAASGAGDGHSVPWNELIIPQVVNVSIFFTILFILLRNPIKNHFAGKVKSFETAKHEAEKAKSTAEQTHNEIKMRLDQLKTSAEESLKVAHAEAEALKLKIISEAKIQADQLKKEAERSAEHELQKAMFSLKTELVKNSIQVAKTDIKENANADTNQRLQKEFVLKAQGVNL